MLPTPVRPNGFPSSPRVSVLMAAFNTAPFLLQALESISRQSFRYFELIVIDDGSTDGTTALLTDYLDKEPRMRLISRPNRGVIATRNELMHAARGELLAWMDSDDVSLPDRLSLQVAAFENDSALVCIGTAAQCVDPDGLPLNTERYSPGHHEILQAQQENGGMRFPTTMMKRQCALEAGGFREPFKLGEDFDLLLRLSELGKMANLESVQYFYRQHLASACAVLGPRWLAYREQILALARERKQFGKDRLQDGKSITIDAVAATDIREHVAHIYSHWARGALENADRSRARRYLWAALRARPFSTEVWKNVVRVTLR